VTPPNDWEIKKCLRLALALMLATAGLVGLAGFGFDIPVLRQVIGFVFLTFVPGLLILRILKIHRVSAVESLLYSVGLSIAFIMFTGLLANFVLPLIGVSRPISILPLGATLTAFTLILGVIAYIRDRDFSAPTQFNKTSIARILSPTYLLLLLLPLLAVLGTLLVNVYHNNLVLLFFIVVVACIVVLAAFRKLPQNAYGMAIAMIALGLLLHTSLVSSGLAFSHLQGLYGGDIHVEYYLQNLVLQNGYWDATIPNTYNTALSVVLLCPTYSMVLGLDGVWVLRVMYPLIFSLVPLVLFHIFREQIGARRAFLSAFFFMTMITFFTLMTITTRQQIAELFFALLVLLMIDRRLMPKQRVTLAITFSASLIVSHYALAYIGFFFLVVGWCLWLLMGSRLRVAWQWLTRRFGGLPQQIVFSRAFSAKAMAIVVVLYLVFTLGWYAGVGQGTALHSLLNIGQEQYSLVSSEPGPSEPGPSEPGPASGGGFFDLAERDPFVATALGLDFASASGLGKGFRILQYLTQLLVVIGFAWLILRPRGFKAEFIALAAVSAFILLACIVVPRLSSYISLGRAYHVSLFLLSPLLVLGGEAVWDGGRRLSRSVSSCLKSGQRLVLQPRLGGSSPLLVSLALALLVPYFLFTSGFLFEVSRSSLYGAGDLPSSMALSGYRIGLEEDIGIYNAEEFEAAEWLADNLPDDATVYADKYGRRLLYDQLWGRVGLITASGEVPEDAYIFLRTWNLDRQEIAVVEVSGVQATIGHVSFSEIPAFVDRLGNSTVIYSNGGAQILAPEQD